MKLKHIYKLTIITLISFILFNGLYKYDNKYTHKSTQAINGMLVIDEEDLNKCAYRYLIYGWSFYPGELLSPEDFKYGNPKKYMYYTSIGENVRFNNDMSDTPHGSGSYVLEIELPNDEKAYTLEVPEIFSSYELYINDELISKAGEPNINNYEPKTKNKVLTFEAKDKIRIIISVSDFSHFYSGMIYPIAFGTSEVNSVVGIKLGIRIFIMTIGILASILSLYMGAKTKYKNAIIFSMICICMCGLTSYPLIHTMFELSLFPWYAIEVTCSYIVTMMIVILYNRICNVNIRTKKMTNYISIIFCFIVFVYSLCSSRLNVITMDVFSNISYIYKFSISIYILYTSYNNYHKVKDKGSRCMIYSSIIYSQAFIWDFIYPLYEPIYGGWFNEWGSIVLVISIGYILFRDMVGAYEQNINLKEEHKQIEKQLHIHKEYANQISKKHEENKRLIHDFRQHIITIDSMAKNIDDNYNNLNEREKLINYLTQVNLNINDTQNKSNLMFCKNSSVNSILTYYYSISKNHNINSTFELYLPNNLSLNDVELCTIIGNLCENAVEACSKEGIKDKYINIATKKRKESIMILIENSYNGKYNMIGDKFVSTKGETSRIGIGLESIKDIINKHNGSIQIYPSETKFRIIISLPIN